jgi:hypothetical protein
MNLDFVTWQQVRNVVALVWNVNNVCALHDALSNCVRATTEIRVAPG